MGYFIVLSFPNTVTYNANGGIGTVPAPQTVKIKNTIILPGGSGLARDGFTFEGWNINTDGTGANYSGGSSFTPTQNITLYARWEPVFYTVTYNTGGTGQAPAAQTVQAGSSVTLPNGSGFTRSGYIFGGWNSNTNGTGVNYAVGSSFTPIANITLYAKWDPVPVTNYTVTYNANGGTPTPPTQTVRAGSNVTLPSGLTRSDYTFGGWNTRADGTGTNRTAGSSFTPIANITLYAKWDPIPVTNYTVTFNANGGTP
ncbi:MAG: InlB B-repeat-containing protein, partial [Treponema sp.]|nr:InlB B-repeat-containing protein [Treponema sp.]